MERITSRTERKGVRTDSTGRPVQNSILRSIPDGEFKLLRRHLEPLNLAPQRILHEAGAKIDFAYFLNGGMASLVVLTSDERSVEVAIVGKEGIVNTPLVAGLNRGPHRVVMQNCRKRAQGAICDLDGNAPVGAGAQQVWNRYVLIQGLQVAQIAACNRLHEIEQRLARWLLMCQDRIDRDRLLVTHEFLAQMLGTGRPSVSLAAGILQRGGLIDNGRGAVTIVDRPGLENASCECYRVMKHLNGVPRKQ